MQFPSFLFDWCYILLLVLNSLNFLGRNPLYLGIIFVAFLLVKALWVQLDISGEFRNGAVSGQISLFKIIASQRAILFVILVARTWCE